MLIDEFPNTFITVDIHTSGQFATGETTARASWYGVSGVPDVRTDGMNATVGASSCNGAYTAYRAKYITRMAAVANLSPVSIEGTLRIDGDQITMEAKYRLEDPTPLVSMQASLFLYEDDVYYNATTSFNHIARSIYHQTVTLNNVGDEVTVTRTVTANGDWELDQLRAVAILQRPNGNKEIFQAGRLPFVQDYSLTFAEQVRSVPDGSGDAIFHGTLTNTSETADTYDLTLQNDFGWPMAYQIGADPNWYTDLQQVSLGIGASIDLIVKVSTDAVERIGAGQFKCQSVATGHLSPIALKVFNLSPSVLLVDDDGTQTQETPFTAGLDALGYLREEWDATNDHSGYTPGLSEMLGYDVILWQTGTRYQGQLLDSSEQQRLAAYLDGGGSFFLVSPALLVNVAPPNNFIVNYLGVTSRTNYTGGTTAVGEAGDPITDGMSLPLTYVPGENQIATVNPTASASVIFRTQTGNPAALRNTTAGGSRVVFSTILQSAYPQSGDYPNTSIVVVQRVLDWLLDTSSSESVPDGMTAASSLRVIPNPMTTNADLRWSIAPNALGGAVTLSIVDVTGRRVRLLHDGPCTAGAGSVSWNGADDAGRMLPSGIYFARLQSASGVSAQRVVLAR